MGTILFKDGTTAYGYVQIYQGACLAGEPTAYVIRKGSLVWLRPGESVQWIEA